MTRSATAVKSRSTKQTKRSAPPPPDDKPIIALDLGRTNLSPAMQAYFQKCQEKLGFIPNVLAAYAFDSIKLEAFVAM